MLTIDNNVFIADFNQPRIQTLFTTFHFDTLIDRQISCLTTTHMPCCLCFSKRFAFQVIDSFDYDRSSSHTCCHIVGTLQNIHNSKLQDKKMMEK